MKCTIKLSHIKVGDQTTTIPFWFTRDKSIHLNMSTPQLDVDLESLNKENIYQLLVSVKKHLIEVDSLEDLQEKYDEIFGKQKTESKVVKKAIKEDRETVQPKKRPLSKKQLDSLKKTQITEAARKILKKKSVKSIMSDIGYAEFSDEEKKILSPGIADMELLKELLKWETNSKNSRKTIVNLIKKRIALLKESHAVEEVDDMSDIQKELDSQVEKPESKKEPESESEPNKEDK